MSRIDEDQIVFTGGCPECGSPAGHNAGCIHSIRARNAEINRLKVETERLRNALHAIRDSLAGHQHADCNRCAFCRIMRDCDAAITANKEVDRDE